jgi:hypothetical protein
MFNFNRLSDFDKVLNNLVDEFFELANYRLSQVDDQGYVSTTTKEVSPPVEEKCECKCEDTSPCCNTECNEDVCTCECADELFMPYEVEPVTSNGWYKNSNEEWTRDVFLPVDKEYAEVNILNGVKVQVSYEQSSRRNEENVTGYSHQSGNYVYPLPDNADISTFRARTVGSYIVLTVAEFTPKCESGSCQTINIE